MPERQRFLVTGCASGIGRSLADAIVGSGYELCATDIDYDALAAYAQERDWPDDRVSIRRLDVTDALAWEAIVGGVVRQFGGIDVLVNVAGFLVPGWVHEVDEDDVHRQVDINFKGVAFGLRTVAARMVEQRSGHIINVASMAALAPIQGIAIYSATKYAVRSLSLAAAQELREHGVKVSVVCPDAVRTPMLDLQRDYEEAAMTFSGPRVLEPSEVTDAILGRVLRDAPLEVFLPPSRGWLARVADVFPRSAERIAPLLKRRGRSKQKGL